MSNRPHPFRFRVFRRLARHAHSTTSSARSASRPPATQPCRPSSKAAWRCCIPTGSTTPARRSAACSSRIPTCAMAYWGIALDLLGNTLSSPPLGAGRARGVGAAREGARRRGRRPNASALWIDAIRAYFRDYDKLPVERGLTAYNKAMQQLAERYPRRLRGAGLLRADAAGVGAEERHDLRQPVQVGGDARKALHAATRSIPASRIT